MGVAQRAQDCALEFIYKTKNPSLAARCHGSRCSHPDPREKQSENKLTLICLYFLEIFFLIKELNESSSGGFHGSSAQPQNSSLSVALVMELLWVLKASLGFPLRRPEEMSVAGRVSEVHSSLGCAGGAQPGAWQLPGS